MDCQSLAIALQDLSRSLQELAVDPSSFVLHRSQCCCLSESYALAVEHVTQQLHLILSTGLDSHACQNLLPSFLELQHAMLQGSKLMHDCLYQDGWVKKAVVLALSTEAQDVCLHDLVWCLCVIQQAMGQLVLQDNEPESSVYGSLNVVWAETSQKEDLDVLLDALQHDIARWEHQLSADNLSSISTTQAEEQCCLAKFLLGKLSRECHVDNISAPWEALPWAEAHEFSIKEVIGHGAFAVVSKVQWHGGIYGQKEFFGVDRDVFAREAAIQARLRHPNLLQLICCISKPTQSRCSLVMELMDMDLRSMINNRLKDGFNPPFSLLTCVDIMLQIAKGMEHLHSLHIMHRDLKAVNLLVSKQTSVIHETSSDCRLRVKIADFGMSKAKNQSSKYTTLHAGTTFWRAPEVFDVNPESEFQKKPTAKYTKKADVYSFAMVCYEILSGNVPFDDGCKLGKLHQRLRKGERPKLPSSCPPYLVSYIERCWHREPEQRPSFTQISRTLRHMKGILLTSTGLRTPLALSTRSCTRIEDKLEQMMGSQWPSASSVWFSTRSMTISFEMSWYKVMECKLTHQKVAENPAGKMMQSLFLSDSGILKYNRRLRDCIRVTLSWFGIGIWRRHGCCELTIPDKLAQPTIDTSALLGEGGSGRVYRGTLPDGQAVAVKVLPAKSSNADGQLFSELDLIGRVSHRNVVRLLGYCSNEQSYMLIYKFMPRRDLGRYLYGQRKAMGLTWAQRYKIACGVASALDHLHNQISPRIVHRDVKPSNILLDATYNAVLADFGIALCQGNKDADENILQKETAVRGTPGYMDPEYMYTLQLGPEVDVYGFGVVLLQLVSGRRFLEEDKISVMKYVWECYKNGQLLDAVDERVRANGNHDDDDGMTRMLLLGLLCCQSKGRHQPTMHEVVQFLSGRGEVPVLSSDMELFY